MKQLRSIRLGNKVYVFDTENLEKTGRNIGIVASYALMIAGRVAINRKIKKEINKLFR